jgi:hypothetical protein
MKIQVYHEDEAESQAALGRIAKHGGFELFSAL